MKAWSFRLWKLEKKETAASEDTLKLADNFLGRTREEKTTETILKILEMGGINW